ncbi:NGG1p interacting factor 3 protein, NIF3 [Marinomonas sp. S3726]|uniref:NGG1p interacting factor 3 protein, NIF3 n=1 Tax=Marinomonas sp. S3726 TaxID=579484 RepID=UPI0005FA4F6E|nr:NGG1p interacting factor 3 protein, NIF3 [Marinomonas sp. S3726]KJZ12808.1 NGG1p interacting factor 3 protein, NIF3 [Marinomonas sp. S3726]
MYSLVFYVPESHLEEVKEALFDVGAGAIGDYEACCWQVKGQGQFRPNANANPFIGVKGELETLAEYRVEMVLKLSLKEVAIKALKAAHPFEEVAYHLIKVES